MGIDVECPESGTITIEKYNVALPKLCDKQGRCVLPIAEGRILEMDSCFDNPFFWYFPFDHSRCVPFPHQQPDAGCIPSHVARSRRVIPIHSWGSSAAEGRSARSILVGLAGFLLMNYTFVVFHILCDDCPAPPGVVKRP